jgi:uncharacterized membrane protein
VSTKAQSISTPDNRLAFVDVLRGIAVVTMIWFHTADGWIRSDLRIGIAWTIIRSVGGLAAPLFLTLAGISLGLKTSAQIRRGDDRRKLMRVSLVRGLQLIILGYLLRLQMWLVDFGAVSDLKNWIPGVFLLVAYLFAYFALDRTDRIRPFYLFCIFAFSVFLITAAISQVLKTSPHRLLGILRIDVLQSIGGSLVIASLIGFSIDLFLKRPYLGILFGFAVTVATPFLKEVVPGPLPHAIAGYLASWPPAPGKKAISLFPLFPWMAYAFIGIAIGAYWERAKNRGAIVKSVAALSAFGALLAFLSFESHSFVFRLISDYPLLLQPFRVIYRIGAVLMLGGFALLMSRPGWITGRLPFRTLGRASLLIYWVHLEFAYGYFGKPLSASLEISQWWWGFIALTACMIGVAWLRINAVDVRTWFYRNGITTIRQERS